MNTLARLSFSLLASGAISACMVVVPPKDGTSASKADYQPWTPLRDETTCMPESTAILDKADAALASGNHSSALSQADSAVPVIERERQTCRSEAATRVVSRAALILAEARVAKGDLLEALVRLERGPLLDGDHGCRESTNRKERCNTLAKQMTDTFKAFETIPYFRTTPYAIVLNNAITVESLQVVDNTYIGREWFVLDVVPTKVTARKDGGLELKVEGSDQSIGGTSWSKVGNVRINGEDYTVKKGDYSVSHLKKGILIANVPAEDASIVEVGKRYKLVIQKKDWKRAGPTWTASSARIAAVHQVSDRR
jgi:hypothetical protein